MKTIDKDRVLRLNCPGYGEEAFLNLGQAKPLDHYQVIIANPVSLLHLFDKGPEATRRINQFVAEGVNQLNVPDDALIQELINESEARLEQLIPFLTQGGLLIYFLTRPFILAGPTISVDNYDWLSVYAPAQKNPEGTGPRQMSAFSHGRIIEPTDEGLQSEMAEYLAQPGLEWNTIIRSDFLSNNYSVLATAGSKKCISAQFWAGDRGGRVIFLPAPYSPDFDKALMNCVDKWYQEALRQGFIKVDENGRQEQEAVQAAVPGAPLVEAAPQLAPPSTEILSDVESLAASLVNQLELAGAKSVTETPAPVTYQAPAPVPTLSASPTLAPSPAPVPVSAPAPVAAPVFNPAPAAVSKPAARGALKSLFSSSDSDPFDDDELEPKTETTQAEQPMVQKVTAEDILKSVSMEAERIANEPQVPVSAPETLDDAAQAMAALVAQATAALPEIESSSPAALHAPEATAEPTAAPLAMTRPSSHDLIASLEPASAQAALAPSGEELIAQQSLTEDPIGEAQSKKTEAETTIISNFELKKATADMDLSEFAETARQLVQQANEIESATREPGKPPAPTPRSKISDILRGLENPPEPKPSEPQPSELTLEGILKQETQTEPELQSTQSAPMEPATVPARPDKPSSDMTMDEFRKTFEFLKEGLEQEAAKQVQKGSDPAQAGALSELMNALKSTQLPEPAASPPPQAPIPPAEPAPAAESEQAKELRSLMQSLANQEKAANTPYLSGEFPAVPQFAEGSQSSEAVEQAAHESDLSQEDLKSMFEPFKSADKFDETSTQESIPVLEIASEIIQPNYQAELLGQPDLLKSEEEAAPDQVQAPFMAPLQAPLAAPAIAQVSEPTSPVPPKPLPFLQAPAPSPAPVPVPVLANLPMPETARPATAQAGPVPEPLPITVQEAVVSPLPIAQAAPQVSESAPDMAIAQPASPAAPPYFADQSQVEPLPPPVFSQTPAQAETLSELEKAAFAAFATPPANPEPQPEPAIAAIETTEPPPLVPQTAFAALPTGEASSTSIEAVSQPATALPEPDAFAHTDTPPASTNLQTAPVAAVSTGNNADLHQPQILMTSTIDSGDTTQTKELMMKMEELTQTIPANWTAEFSFPYIDSLKGEHGQMMEQLRQAQLRLSGLEARIRAMDGLKTVLLTGENDALMAGAQEVLSRLGWTVTPSRSNQNELWLSRGDQIDAIARIVRSPATANRSEIAQLAESVIGFWDEYEIEPKGILIAQTWFTKAPPERNEPDFTPALQEFAGKKNLCLMSSLQILAMYKDLELNAMPVEEMRKKMLETNGRLPGFTLENATQQAATV